MSRWPLVSLLLLLMACSRSSRPVPLFPVSGELTFEGKPCNGALVLLHPTGESNPPTPRPRAIVQSNGAFEVMTSKPGDGAPEGEYTLSVEWRKVDDHPEQGMSLIPSRYGDPKTSGLKVIVKAEANVIPPIRLTR